MNLASSVIYTDENEIEDIQNSNLVSPNNQLGGNNMRRSSKWTLMQNPFISDVNTNKLNNVLSFYEDVEVSLNYFKEYIADIQKECKTNNNLHKISLSTNYNSVIRRRGLSEKHSAQNKKFFNKERKVK